MKHISILITICALVFAQMAHAAKIVTKLDQDGITYQLYDDNTAILTKRQGALDDIVLPSTITHNGKDYTLTRIGNNAFCESGILSITIPNTVTTIGDAAFYGCSDLTSVTIPNSVSTIEGYAFYSCKNLRSVTIGAFVQSIGKNAFSGCSMLKEVIFFPTAQPVVDFDVFGGRSEGCMFKCYVDNYDYDFVNELVCLPFNDADMLRYRSSVTDAINIAASKVALNDDDKTAIDGYKNAISEGDDVVGNELAAHRVIALAGIRQALPSDGLLEEEQTVVNGKIASINSATSLAGIYTPQKEAIDHMALHPQKISALAAIEEALQGNTNSKYLNDLIKEQVTTIKNATDAKTITNKEQEAVNKLQSEIGKYTAIKDEALGTLGTKQNGPALIVTDKDGNEVILYSPKSVEYIKVNEE